jgi:hypothetical protein
MAGWCINHWWACIAAYAGGCAAFYGYLWWEARRFERLAARREARAARLERWSAYVSAWDDEQEPDDVVFARSVMATINAL